MITINANTLKGNIRYNFEIYRDINYNDPIINIEGNTITVSLNDMIIIPNNKSINKTNMRCTGIKGYISMDTLNVLSKRIDEVVINCNNLKTDLEIIKIIDGIIHIDLEDVVIYKNPI